MIVDRHHLVLYAAVLVIGAGGAYGYHIRSMDVARAEAKAEAQEKVIAAADQRAAARDAQTKQEIAAIMALKSTPATTPTQIIERIPQMFPDLHPTLQQPTNPQTGKPDTSAPPQLVFDAPQAKALNDTLVECRVCQLERDKAKADLDDMKKTILPAKDKEISQWKDAAKGGSIWKRVGKIAVVTGCAVAGAYVGSARGTKAAGIGGGAGALTCGIVVH